MAYVTLLYKSCLAWRLLITGLQDKHLVGSHTVLGSTGVVREGREACLHPSQHLLHLSLLWVHNLKGWPPLPVLWQRGWLALADSAQLIAKPVGELSPVLLALQVHLPGVRYQIAPLSM